jgi:hypothetical protein
MNSDSEAPRLQGGASKKNNFINDSSACIPLFGEEGPGEIFKEIIPKIPLSPQRIRRGG